MADLNELSAQEIGRRLRIARENADIRQDDAAQVIGMSRPTLVSIEKGVRRVRIQEIQMLARHYGVSVNALLRREAVHTDLMPRFRKLRETDRLLGEGQELPEVCKLLEVSEATYHRWRAQYGGMKADDVKRLKELELENARLKRLLAEKELDNDMLREVARGNW